MNITGYAVVRTGRGGLQIIDAGVCRTISTDPLETRLAAIETDISELFEQQTPALVAVEKLYAHYRHPQTAVIMGHVRGVILAAAARCAIEVHGYGATQVKRFLTGSGRASKGQVQQAIMRELKLPVLPEPPDVADALAVALCCIGDTRGVKASWRQRTSTRTVPRER